MYIVECLDVMLYILNYLAFEFSKNNHIVALNIWS
jgi:hypothetical protein